MKLSELLGNKDFSIEIIDRKHQGDNWYLFIAHLCYREGGSNYHVTIGLMTNLVSEVIQCIYIGHDKATLDVTLPCDAVVRKARRLSNNGYELKLWINSPTQLQSVLSVLNADIRYLIY